MQFHLIVLKSSLNISEFKNLVDKEIYNELDQFIKSKYILKDNSIYTLFNGKLASKKQQILITKINSKKSTRNNLRLLGHNINLECQKQKISKLNLISSKSISIEQINHIYFGFKHSNYKFSKFLAKSKLIDTKIALVNEADQTSLKKLITETEVITSSVNFIRDLVNTPSLDLTPSELVNQAKKIKSDSSKLKLKILNEKDLIKQNLNLIYCVGKGSGQESKLILLEYFNGPKSAAPTLIVGKGVTFDAGGLNLKPTNGIEQMKIDMAGAATVLGLFKLVDKLNLKINLVGAIPAVENLLGHNAYKPGDILRSFSNKTIEITNTDAEGRLILADAISYCIKKYQPAEIIDVATLTGASIAALGHTRTAIIGNNKKLINQMWKSSLKSGDQIWPLPLDKYHRDKVKGEISDYKNWTAGVQAGAIMGAAFIEKFVEKKPWVHLDIAGSAYYETNIAYTNKGATGKPLHLLFEFLKSKTTT